MAKFNKDTQYHFDKNKRRRRIAAAIILGAFGLAVAGHFIYKSCHKKHHEDSQGIFEIKVEGEEVILVGFKSDVTPDQILEVLGDTLTIPSEITKIAEGAFNRDGTLTIPEGITKIDFNGAKIKEIGANAFKEAPFSQELTIPNTVQKIGNGAFYGCPITLLKLPPKVIIQSSDESNGAFAGNPELKAIDLESWDEVNPLGDYTFLGEEQNNGTIYVNEHPQSLSLQWKNYFTETHNFVFGPDNWKMDPEALNIFDIREGVLYGFLEGIEDEDIEKAFPDGNMIIPEEVTSVNDSAFFDPEEGEYGETTIPDAITKITFENPENVESIGSHPFLGATSIEQININEMTNLSSIGDGAFAGCEALYKFDTNGDTTLAITNSFAVFADGYIGDGAFAGCLSIQGIKLPIILDTAYVGEGAFATGGDALKTLDFSNLTINRIENTGYNREYAESDILNWMEKHNLFYFVEPTEPYDQRRIILPKISEAITVDAKEAFLLADTTEESWSYAQHSAFHWLCIETPQESLLYLLNSWELVEAE